MANLLAPSAVGLVFQGVVSIVVAVITSVVGPVIVTRIRSGRKPRGEKAPGGLLYALMGGASAAITFIVVGLLLNAVAPQPSVAITSPAAGQQIDVVVLPSTGSGSFMVSGSSAEVYADPRLRVYVLVHPAEPYAAGWWIQPPATVARSGQWTTQAWYGAREFPPQPGNRIDLLAVVSVSDSVAGRVQISDPKDIQPVAQSDIVGVIIGAVR